MVADTTVGATPRRRASAREKDSASARAKPGAPGKKGSMGKIVVVTGATSGIGLATAVGLAEAGYEVIGTARTDATAERLHDAARAAGVKVRHVCCDVADATSTVRAFTEIAMMTPE